MQITKTKIPEILIIEPKVHSDDRGFFMESFNQKVWQEATGLQTTFVQDNHSHSHQGVLRGLHYQLKQPQDKLVRVAQGEVFDVAVDLRRFSSTFKNWIGVMLSDKNKRQLWVPKGFGHGFLVLSSSADVLYKTTDYYVPEFACCLNWNDPDIGIEWPWQEHPILSEKDAAAPRLLSAQIFEQV